MKPTTSTGSNILGLSSRIAAIHLGMVAITSAATVTDFNPAQPLVVSNTGGFTGTFSPENPYIEARIIFQFSGLDPSPLPAGFQISGISLQGNGITGSLSYSAVNVGQNGTVATSYVNLSSATPSLDFSNSNVSFQLPAGAINDGASFTVRVQYRDEFGLQANTSTGVVYNAVIPEPSSALLGVLGSILLFRRRRAG